MSVTSPRHTRTRQGMRDGLPLPPAPATLDPYTPHLIAVPLPRRHPCPLALLGMTSDPAPALSQDVAQRVTALVDRFVLCRSAQEVDVDAPRRGVQANLFDNFAAE